LQGVVGDGAVGAPDSGVVPGDAKTGKEMEALDISAGVSQDDACQSGIEPAREKSNTFRFLHGRLDDMGLALSQTRRPVLPGGELATIAWVRPLN